jgi:NADPH2:quinone reductase
LKAIYLTEFGGPERLDLREWPNPNIRPHDLIVEVRAAGVNRADLSYRRGAYGRADFGDSDLMGQRRLSRPTSLYFIWGASPAANRF